MSKKQIEAVIARKDELEEENCKLKAEIEALKGAVGGHSNDGMHEVIFVADKEIQVMMALAMISDKGIQVDESLVVDDIPEIFNSVESNNGIAEIAFVEANGTIPENFEFVEANNGIAENLAVNGAIPESLPFVEANNNNTKNLTVVKNGGNGAIPRNVAVVSIRNILFEYLPWLRVVNEPNDFYNLESILLLEKSLQTAMISTTADKINAPTEEGYMKHFICSVFTRQFFVSSIGFNARGKKVHFKGTILLHCFAASMMQKFQKSNTEEEAAKVIEQYEKTIQNYVTDFKLLVKRNPHNWIC